MKRFLIVLFLLVGCSRSLQAPDLGQLYNRSAQYHGPERNPVVVIPGILGSKLRDSNSGVSVWGAWDKTYADPSEAAGMRLIAHPMRKNSKLSELKDGVTADGALDKVKISLFGYPIELNAYFNILSVLGAGGFRDEQLALAGAIDYGDDHFSCFQFPYDWRRDNVENARLLHDFLVQKRKEVQQKIEERYGLKNYPVKFDIVAHSMGGLLTRYYLRYGDQDLPEDGRVPKVSWGGSKLVERVLLVGTPSGGSIVALQDLNEGKDLAPVIPTYPSTILGTLPSIYQLLPRTRHKKALSKVGREALDFFEVETWEKYKLGLLSKDADEILKMLLPNASSTSERRDIARDHLEKSLLRAKQLHAALDVEAPLPPNLELHLIAGDAIPTYSHALIEEGNVSLSQQGPGDGVVLRTSALMDERASGNWQPGLQSPVDWSSVFFIFKEHLELTADTAFADNVLYFLLEKPKP